MVPTEVTLARSRTGVVLFTDVVGSTDRDHRLGVTGANEFRRQHFAMCAEMVDRFGGWLVKFTGDGLLAVFESSTASLDCAVALQQGVANSRVDGDPASIRIGVSAGEITVDSGDCYGVAVVEAARLCALAEAGEILIADVVRVLSGSSVHPMRSVGPRRLKGIDTPIETHIVVWRPLARSQASDFVDLDSKVATVERIAHLLDMIGNSPFMSEIRDRIHDLLNPQPGQVILDAGSGAGVDAMLLWDLVGPEGRVVALDQSSKMTKEASERAASAGYGAVEFVTGDVEHLDFADDTFDGIRSDRLFQYLLEPLRALAEMVRVTRPGGRIVVAETDWETAVFDSTDDDITARINRAWLVTRPNGRAGHQLYRLFKVAGIVDVTVEARTNVKTDLDELYRDVIRRLAAQAVAVDAVTRDEASRWIALLETAADEGTFLRAFSTFVVAGRVGAIGGQLPANR